jgi:hypothetical protein
MPKSEGYDPSEHDYFGVKQSETPEGVGAKYPMDNCSDVEDAWNLRGNVDAISKSELERRIKARASDLGCPDSKKPWKG